MLWRVLYVVLAFWILVAGGVFLLALSGGPAGIGNQLHAGSTLPTATAERSGDKQRPHGCRVH